MSSSKREPPKDSSRKGSSVAVPQAKGKTDQPDRLAAALRDNLKRRKAQARARREPGSGHQEG